MALSSMEQFALNTKSYRVVKVTPRSKREKIQIYESTSLSGYWTSVEEMVQEVERAAQGLETWFIELETVYEYGDEQARLSLSGYRDATEEEAEYLRERISREEDERQAYIAAQEEQLVARLRAARPELFK